MPVAGVAQSSWSLRIALGLAGAAAARDVRGGPRSPVSAATRPAGGDAADAERLGARGRIAADGEALLNDTVIAPSLCRLVSNRRNLHAGSDRAWVERNVAGESRQADPAVRSGSVRGLLTLTHRTTAGEGREGR